jgi:hypothetical protein
MKFKGKKSNIVIISNNNKKNKDQIKQIKSLKNDEIEE